MGLASRTTTSRTRRSVGSRAASSTSPTTASTGTWNPARATRSPTTSKATPRSPPGTITYKHLWEAGHQVRQRPQEEGRQEGRPGRHLPAHDPRAPRRHAGLRPHRRHPLHRVRRLLGRRSARPRPQRRRHRHDHRRHRPARRQAHPAQDHGRRRPGGVPRRQDLHRGQAHRRRRSPGPKAATSGTKTRWPPPTSPRDCPCEEMDAEDPLFILYTSGSTGKPKGVMHTTGGYLLYAAMTHELIFDYHPEQVYWCTADIGWVTGHTYIVYGPLVERRHRHPVRGRAELPDPGPLLGRGREVQGQHLLHRSHRSALHRPRRRRLGQEARPLLPARAGHRGRAHQPGSLALVPRPHRRRQLPDRGHLVADRDRRHPHHPAPGRDEDQAGFGHPARSSASSPSSSTRTAKKIDRPRRGQPLHGAARGPA